MSLLFIAGICIVPIPHLATYPMYFNYSWLETAPPFPRKRGKNNHCVSTIWCKLYHTVFLKNKSDVYVYNYIPVRFTSHLNRFIIKQLVVIFMCISANGNNFLFFHFVSNLREIWNEAYLKTVQG